VPAVTADDDSRYYSDPSHPVLQCCRRLLLLLIYRLT